MHLVFLNQYYPPDAAPTGVMLEGLVEELARSGHQVTVLCAAGGYAENRTSNIEHRTSNIEHRTSNIEHRTANIENRKRETERAIHSTLPSNSQPSTINSQLSPEFTSLRGMNESRDESRGPCPPVSGSQHSTINAQPLHSSPQPSTINQQPIHILRLRAFRFGRGTFIGKLLDYASYYVGVAWKLLTLRPAPDRIVALTTPPFLSVLARLLSKVRGADHAHWVMDLYPDVMAAHGMLGEKSAIYRILAGLARWGFGGRRCAAVLTLGPDMAERVGRVMGKKLKTEKLKTEKEIMVPAQPAVLASTFNSQLSSIQWVPLWGESSSAGVSPASSFPGEVEKAQDMESGQDAPSTVWSETLQPPEEGDEDVASPYRSATSAALRRNRGWKDNELVVMYSGNMGLGHRFGEILAAAGRVNIEHRSEEVADIGDISLRRMNESRDESRGPVLPPMGLSNDQPSTLNHQLSPIRFVFFGGGRRRVEVEAFVRENPEWGVEVHDYAPAEELAAHLQSADVHLASLDVAWTGTMVPSKLQGIFAAGRPVIFIGSAESSIGMWVAESGGGWVVKEGDVDGLLAALDEARNPDIRLTRGRAARDFADKHFDKRTNVARAAAILSRSC